ncbi:MAG: efflux RND transporter permease subunit [Treponema sp.]|nr:efflux RND transporter permease subunit [Candidatus Treponema merdequi]
MKKDFIYFSVKHPVSTLMILLSVIMIGLICSFCIKIDYLPFLSERNILVKTSYEGVSAKELEKLVTIQIEDSFASLKGIKNIKSVTRDGISLLDIELQWGTDIDIAVTEAREIIDTAYQSLPAGCSKPTAEIFNPSNKNTITIAAKSNDNDLIYCRYIIDNEIKQRLQRINGVSSISVTGGEKEEIQVLLNKSLIDSRGLTLQSVSECLSYANFEYPAGTIREGNKDIMLKTSGLFKNISEIETTPVSFNNGGLLHISDIADVIKTTKDKDAFFIFNGTEAIEIAIQKKNATSPLKLSKLVNQEIKRLNDLYGTYFTFEVVQDNSIQIKESIIQLILSALAGFIIAFIILWIFFKKIRTSFLVSSIIPLTILFSILCLFAFGKTINILSLSGIAIGIGMVIDGSTIVIESIAKKLEQNDEELSDSIIKASQEVSLSTVGSTLTTIIVFIPFFFESGLLGELFSDMSIAVISSISFSCILALTYIPAVSYLFEKNNPDRTDRSVKIYHLENQYSKTLNFCFTKKLFIPILITGCILITLIPVKILKKEFLPQTYNEELNIELFFTSGTTVEKLYENGNYLSSVIKTIPSVKQILLSGGIDKENTNLLIDPSKQTERINISILCSDKKELKKQLTNLFDNTKIKYHFAEDTSILSTILAVQTDTYVIQDTSEDIVVEKAKHITDDENSIIPNSYVTEYIFNPDRLICSRFNVSAIYTAQLAHDTLEGLKSCYFYDKGIRIPIVVKYPKQNILSIKDIENTNILLENSFVPLRILGSFHKETNENIYYRFNRKNAKLITKKPLIDEENSIINLEKVQIDELFKNGALLLIIILFLLYCIMGAQFESFIIPLLILIAIPPAFSGAFFSLLLFNKSINVNSIIALVVLFGTSVNNAIILYEKCNELEIITKENIIDACKEKLRPVLITTLTTLCALIPFAIDPLNKNAQSSMSIAIIGGLIISTIFVLHVVPPILYLCMRNKKNGK